MKTGYNSEPLSAADYKLRMLRMYGAVQHLFGWLKRISRDNGEPEGRWIENLVNDLRDLHSRTDDSEIIQKPNCRLILMNTKHELNIRGFVLDAKWFEDDDSSYRVLSKNICIGLYFPPEHYPAVDGVFPTITVRANDIVLSKIQLDGTKRLYKPIDDVYWIPANYSRFMTYNLQTGGRPLWRIEIIDLVELKHGYSTTRPALLHHLSLNRKVFKFDGACMCIGELPASSDFCRLLTNDDSVLNYPYVHAANVIKRCWIKYRLRKKRMMIGNEITLMPGLGVTVDELIDRYSHMKGSHTGEPQL